MLLASPPMARITAPMRAATRIAPVLFPDGAGGGGNSPRAFGAAAELRLLVYGRVMRVKGAETVAAAASAIEATLPSGVQLRLIFAGLDWEGVPSASAAHVKVRSRAFAEQLATNLPRAT